jgi:ADP-ribose pyrophosphatase YjhB (NUDIX family)
MRHRTVVGVVLVIESHSEILLGRRTGSTFGEGWWHLPAGHLEADESAITCARREAKEELGIELTEADLGLVHVLHHRDPDEARLHLFFRVSKWRGTIINAEPDRCSELGWFPLSHLPEQTIPYTAEALHAIDRGEPFGAGGWPD